LGLLYTRTGFEKDYDVYGMVTANRYVFLAVVVRGAGQVVEKMFEDWFRMWKMQVLNPFSTVS
jgi:hypothetical protein